MLGTAVSSSTPKRIPKDAPNDSLDHSLGDLGTQSFKSGEDSSASHRTRNSTSAPSQASSSDDGAWGSNFWVTLVDPQTQTQFYACPATGQVDWNPPLNTFVLPPNPDGEWWELSDQSRGGLPYYYQTKTGETVWERPPGFIIPFGIIQESSSGRRLSQADFSGYGKYTSNSLAPSPNGTQSKHPKYQRSKSYSNDHEGSSDAPPKQRSPNKISPGKPAITTGKHSKRSSAQYHPPLHGSYLPPIPGSPYATDNSAPASVASLGAGADRRKSTSSNRSEKPRSNGVVDSHSKTKTKTPYRPSPPQSLNAAMELIASHSEPDLKFKAQSSSQGSRLKTDDESTSGTSRSSLSSRKGKPGLVSISPARPIPGTPGTTKTTRSTSSPNIGGKKIGAPVLNPDAAFSMSPIKNQSAGKPILVLANAKAQPDTDSATIRTLASGTYPILPHDLANDIQQFSESEFARQYFSTHRTGFIFRRRVPVAQMMTWQKQPLSSPLLSINRNLARDAVKIFKVIQYVMGDREKEKGPGYRLPPDTSLVSHNNSTTSISRATSDLLEAQRWILNEGLRHGELRDEIYCQLMKQLSGNPSSEGVFKGWQLLCVLLITFPPSKNFEPSLFSFFQQHTSKEENRVDIMAKYCSRRLGQITRKGPRGKPPTIAEIETAADAAFNPSTFGESLDMIIRIQERSYPTQKVPIILPFLTDGILALGGTKCEGIFRVPGDGDSVSDLKTRIDKGYYTLEGVDDPHVLASLMKLWMRELCSPLIPDEMYNECITSCQSPTACVQIVERLPTYNRRVVLFVISFLQLFLDERVQQATKMTPENLALVMAPNLLRCASDSMTVVFTNAQYEQTFVYNLLLNLQSSQVDLDYTPIHGVGAVHASSSKSRTRRA